jgi:hypothetical protein
VWSSAKSEASRVSFLTRRQANPLRPERIGQMHTGAGVEVHINRPVATVVACNTT